MANPTGREPSLPQDSDLSGREPALGGVKSVVVTGWHDPSINWGNLHHIAIALNLQYFAPKQQEQIFGMFKEGAIIYLLNNGQFARVLKVAIVRGTEDVVGDFGRVSANVIVLGQMIEVVFDGITMPDIPALPEGVYRGYSFLDRPTPSIADAYFYHPGEL